MNVDKVLLVSMDRVFYKVAKLILNVDKDIAALMEFVIQLHLMDGQIVHVDSPLNALVQTWTVLN